MSSKTTSDTADSSQELSQAASEKPGWNGATYRRNLILASICLMVLFAPNFVSNALRGNIQIGMLRWEVSHRMYQIRALLVGSSELEALRNAIVGQESGGDPGLLNASGSGAMGLAQVMPESLALWSREIYGREISEREFLDDPSLQMHLVESKLQQYWIEAIWQAHGDRDEAVKRVASWWYSGDPGLFRDDRPQYWDGDEYPSIASYSKQVLRRFKSQHIVQSS